MSLHTLTFKILTPLFLGGANPSIPEIRPPSIKGALRFWYRLYHPTTDMAQLAKEENALFGGVGESASKSRLILRIPHQELKPSNHPLPKETVRYTKYVNGRERSFPINLLEYLCYGTYEYQKGKGNVFTRSYIKENESFTLHYSIRKATETDQEVITKAFDCLIAFGGLGSRSRNGFGSLSCKELATDYFQLAKTLQQRSLKLSNYTAASTELALFETPQDYPTWHAALAALGKAYRTSRMDVEPKHRYQKRAYLAAPIIVDKKQESFLDRHAKPYFMNIVEQNGRYKGIVLFLPYAFLADSDDFSDREKARHLQEYQTVTKQFNQLLEGHLKQVL
ncbi:MAG: type III-B CRISPR module RAMP protein Cmr1 [Flammeovirgaceae bacterium]